MCNAPTSKYKYQVFHDFILPNQREIRFVDGGIKFCGINTVGEYVTNKTGMHDSMVIIFDGRGSFIGSTALRFSSIRQ